MNQCANCLMFINNLDLVTVLIPNTGVEIDIFLCDDCINGQELD